MPNPTLLNRLESAAALVSRQPSLKYTVFFVFELRFDCPQLLLLCVACNASCHAGRFPFDR